MLRRARDISSSSEPATARPPGRRVCGVELRRLIGRDEVAVARTRARRFVADRRVLVTGAQGTFGAQLCRQVGRLGPATLHRLDDDEICDRRRVDELFAEIRPELVFHAADRRNLPRLEHNPCEGVRINVLGTQNLVTAAVRSRVDRFVLVSTDQAAEPASVLGATKRLSELVLHAAAGGNTCFAAVRIGTFIGSRWSPLWLVSAGQAVTLAHPDVARHFMTMEEAAGLVLEAAAMAEEAETFVLDTGDPVPVVDLVYRYAEQLHLPEVTIRFTGLQPGERVRTQLFSHTEVRIRTAHPRIWAARAIPLPAETKRLLDGLFSAAGREDHDEVRLLMRRILPEYRR